MFIHVIIFDMLVVSVTQMFTRIMKNNNVCMYVAQYYVKIKNIIN